MVGKLIQVKPNQEVFCYEFSRNLCAVFNIKLLPGIYLITDVYENDFCSILVNDNIFITRTSNIKDMIILDSPN